MDHLPIPQDAVPFIIAPYEAPADFWYDGQGFLDFPKRRNWTEEQLRGGDDLSKEDYLDKNGFKSKGSNFEVEQFFQTWLFFGLLVEFMKMGGVHVSTEDFLKQQGQIKAKIVTTSRLPALLVQWKKGIRSRWDLADAWQKLNEMFEKTESLLNRYCVQDKDTKPLNLDKPRPWPVRDEISTTMIAIAYSLRRAAIDACEVAGDMDGQSVWPEAQSEILARRLRQKWCLADITTLSKQLSIDGQYYMASSPGLHPDELDHHAKCIKSRCLYDYDLNFYVTRHTGLPYHKEPCENEINYGGHLGPERGQKNWIDAMHRIIDKDAIPIALWLKGPKQLWSVEYHLSGNRKPAYVAISHVWSDGKGNPNANSLPECQLDKIMRLVEKVTWKGRKEVPSNPNLSDGVGFWMDTLCIPAKDKARKANAILSMRHVYSNAKAVLVLDDWLEQTRSDAPVLDIVTRLYQSSWIKRLWTHQEGFLPPAVWVQFSDCSVEMSVLSKKVEDYQSSLKATGIHIGFPDAAGMRLLTLYTFGTEAFKFICELDEKWITYRPLAKVMAERQTARLTDETVCLATIVGIDVQQFLDIPDKPDEDSAKSRMKKFLGVLGRFETSIIFNNYERLEDRGYGWAPKSLLNLRTAEMGNTSDDHDEAESVFEQVNGHLGLLVHYHGFLLDFVNGKPSFAAVERSCAIKCQRATGTEAYLEGKWFVVELSPNQVEWTTRKTYAVILSAIPKAPGQRCQAAVAWSISGPVNGVHTVQHQSIATVRLQETAPLWIDTAEAPLLPKNTPWLVV